MKLKTDIAKRGFRDELHRVFIDWEKRLVMISDGFVAAYRMLGPDDDELDTSGTAINLDPRMNDKVFKAIAKTENLVVSGIFDAELLKLAIQEMKIKLEGNETADNRRVMVEIYKTKTDLGDGYVIAFAQERAASAAMSLVNGVPFAPWKPYLEEQVHDEPKD